MTYRIKDRETWNAIFGGVPPDWFAAGPSDAMVRSLAFFRERSARRLLDLGAGIGRWSVYFARHGIAPIVAVDCAQRGAKITSDWAAREELGIDAVVGDAVALPFADGSFDAILVALVLENLNRHDRRTVVDEIRRVTTTGAPGFFVLNPILTEAEVTALTASGNPTATCHIEPCTDEELAALLSEWQTIQRGTTDERFRFVGAVKG
jgi:ubiquinone/menaquinone biosynthesis C-methylase UbiE